MKRIEKIAGSVAISMLVLSTTASITNAQTVAADPPPILVDQETGNNRELLLFDWLSSATGQLICHSEFYENRRCGTDDTAFWRERDCAGQSLVTNFILNFEANGILLKIFPEQSLLPAGGIRNGTWEVIDGIPVLECEFGDCDSTQFDKYAEHLGGNEVAFYNSPTSRMICTNDNFRLKSISSSVPGQCTVQPPITGDADCDYNNAAINNGWGWNPISGDSCPPLNTPVAIDNCDYSNAAIQDGWGWNPVTLDSCPPL